MCHRLPVLRPWWIPVVGGRYPAERIIESCQVKRVSRPDWFNPQTGWPSFPECQCCCWLPLYNVPFCTSIPQSVFGRKVPGIWCVRVFLAASIESWIGFFWVKDFSSSDNVTTWKSTCTWFWCGTCLYFLRLANLRFLPETNYIIILYMIDWYCKVCCFMQDNCVDKNSPKRVLKPSICKKNTMCLSPV